VDCYINYIVGYINIIHFPEIPQIDYDCFKINYNFKIVVGVVVFVVIVAVVVEDLNF
jgi:hypothetical protein